MWLLADFEEYYEVGEVPLPSSLSRSVLCLGDARGKSRNMVFTALRLKHRELPAWRWGGLISPGGEKRVCGIAAGRRQLHHFYLKLVKVGIWTSFSFL